MDVGEAERLLAAAAHDLREPVRTSQGFLALLEQALADKPPDAVVQEALATTKRSLATLVEMLEDTLAYARAGAGPLAVETVDPDVVLDGVLLRLAGLIQESGALIARDPLPRVKASPAALGLVLQNLIVNAIHFRSALSPAIHVHAEPAPGGHVLCVRDNGRGIDPAWAARMFQPFARFHADVPGTGLGLATSRRLTESMGGRIWAEPVPAGGSVFRVFLKAPGPGS